MRSVQILTDLVFFQHLSQDFIKNIHVILSNSNFSWAGSPLAKKITGQMLAIDGHTENLSMINKEDD